MRKNGLIIIIVFFIVIIVGVASSFIIKTRKDMQKRLIAARSTDRISKINHKVNYEEERRKKMEELDRQKYQGERLIKFFKTIYPDDYVMGDAKNPKVVVLFYGALTCPHCSEAFNDIFFNDKIKDAFFHNGSRVAIIHRPFAADLQSLDALLVLLCKRLPLLQHYNFLKKLYQGQASWAYTSDYRKELEKLIIISKLHTTSEFQQCINNEVLKEKLMRQRADVIIKGGLRATPTIIINGVEYNGSINRLYQAINKELKASDEAKQ